MPESEVTGLGRTLVDVRLSPKVLDPLRGSWLKQCEEHLAHGMDYLVEIADAKLRYATALPLLIGARTIALLRVASWETLAAGVKVSRLEMARLLADTAMACRDSERLRKLYTRLTGQ